MLVLAVGAHEQSNTISIRRQRLRTGLDESIDEQRIDGGYSVVRGAPVPEQLLHLSAARGPPISPVRAEEQRTLPGSRPFGGDSQRLICERTDHDAHTQIPDQV